MRQDRFLIWILVGIGAVVLIALGLFFFRRVEISYLPEDTPSAVLNNYALALHQGDFQRAYQYMAEDEYKPSYLDFRKAFLSDNAISGASLVINETSQVGDEAAISVTVLTANGPFEDTNRQTENASLVKQDDHWKVRLAPYPYWNWGWYEKPVKD